MSIVRKFINITAPPDQPALGESRGELVPVPPESLLADLTSTIVRGHAEVVANALGVVANAIEVGKALMAAKAKIGHGNFGDYCAVECRFTLRTAQNYMKLARGEVEINQALSEKTNGLSYLTLVEAFKIINKLSAKSGRRKAS